MLGAITAGLFGGGAPAAPTPTLWLDASDATTFTFSSGTRVSQWNDKSVNGYNFVQATGANQPDRNATQNSLSAVTLKSSGGTTYFMTNSSYNWAASAFTVFAVVRFNNGNYPAILGRNSTGALALGTDATNNIAISRIGQATSSSNLTQNSGVTSLVIYKSSGISSGNVTVQPYQNTTAGSSTITLASLGAGDKAIIGASADGVSDSLGNSGFLCELQVFNSQLSDTDRATVASGLITKWGL